MDSTTRTGLPIEPATRADHGARDVRPVHDRFATPDPADPSDRGPHVDRVGLIAVDTDAAPEDDGNRPAPEPDAV